MGMKDFFKKMVNLPDDEEYEDDYYDEPSFFDEEDEEDSRQSSTVPKQKKESTDLYLRFESSWKKSCGVTQKKVRSEDLLRS